MKYKQTATSDLIPYANNARLHSDQQVSQIAASIQEFGFINPVIIDGENGVIAGHGRLLAADKLGLKKVPTVSVEHLTPEQKRAYVLADNKLALNAEWDYDLLKTELSSIEGLDLDLIGFDEDEMKKILGSDLSDFGGDDLEVDPIYEVVVSCHDEAEQEAIYKMMTEKGLKCRVLSM